MLAPLRSVPRALSALALNLGALTVVACGPSPDATKETAESVKSHTPVTAAPPSNPQEGPQAPPHLTTNAPSTGVPDPPWFSPALLPGATVTKKGRSPADDQGRFTAQILFAFPTGATLTDCTEPLAGALAKIVPTVAREEKDGRVTLTGDTPEYHVIFMCGEANGTMTAFVSYRWTQPPPPPAR